MKKKTKPSQESINKVFMEMYSSQIISEFKSEDFINEEYAVLKIKFCVKDIIEQALIEDMKSSDLKSDIEEG